MSMVYFRKKYNKYILTERKRGVKFFSLGLDPSFKGENNDTRFERETCCLSCSDFDNTILV